MTDENIGSVLEVIWDRRELVNNHTACDYLLLTLLLGTRRGELYALKWHDDVVSQLRQLQHSVVVLNPRQPVDENTSVPMVYLNDTKNRSDHTLPLVGAALEIIRRRKVERDKHVAERIAEGLPTDDPKSVWVFPARSKRSKLGHYTDSKAILTGIKKDAGLDILRTHDFRRTLATYARKLKDPSMLKRLMNHRNLADTTTAYPLIEWKDISDALLRIQVQMLKNYTPMFDALMPTRKVLKNARNATAADS